MLETTITSRTTTHTSRSAFLVCLALVGSARVAHAEPAKQAMHGPAVDAIRASEPAASIAIRPAPHAHLARIEVTPPELYCSVDGEPAVPSRDLSEVSTEAPHKVRCSATADVGPFVERDVRATAIERITARLSVSSSIATVRIAAVDGSPIENALVTAVGPDGTSIGAFRPTHEAGLYASTIRVPHPVSDFALQVSVNGVGEATTNAVTVDTPVGMDTERDVPAPRRFIPEISAMGTVTVVSANGGGASPGVSIGAAVAVPEDPGVRGSGELLIGLRAGFEKFGFDVATPAGAYIPLGPSGAPLYGTGERSVRMSEQAISVGVPLAYRMRTLGIVKPYASVVPTIYFEHAVGTSDVGRWVNGSSVLPGFTGSLGAQFRAGPIGFFAEAGYRGVLPQKRAVGPVPLSGFSASAGATLPL